MPTLTMFTENNNNNHKVKQYSSRVYFVSLPFTIFPHFISPSFPTLLSIYTFSHFPTTTTTIIHNNSFGIFSIESSP